MPPLWALGNQQSRWSYMDAAEVRTLASEFRARGIPCDVLYLDIDHMDGYRVFTWDSERFPDPAGLIASLRADGFRVVVITDPGVKVDESYDVYVSGRDRGFFCLARDGSEYRNVVWPGLCAFPDFTNPAVREWWGALARRARGRGCGGRVVRHERAGDVRPGPLDDAGGRRAPGRRASAAARRRPQRVRVADGGGGSGRVVVAAPGRPAVRDLTRRLCGVAAARAPVDGRQLVVVGAPVDEHAAAPEPRAVGDRVGGRGRRRVLRRLQRRAARPLDRVRGVPAVLPEPQRDGHGAAGAVGVRGAVGERLPVDAGVADAAAAVSVHGVRGVPSDRRAGAAGAAVRVSR